MVAGNYGRGLALSRMKEALEKGVEELWVDLLPRPTSSDTELHASERLETISQFGAQLLVST